VTSPLTGLLAVAAVLVVATVFGLVRRARDGRLRPVVTAAPHAGVLAGLGVEAGTPVTLVQFSSAFCAPCRATRALCADVAAAVDGVHHLEIDAESHRDAVRALDVRRTPTLLVVDGAGRIVRRAVGRPARDELLAAVDTARTVRSTP
jgi:thiol-disulfide isomerase/thioredoxin